MDSKPLPRLSAWWLGSDAHQRIRVAQTSIAWFLMAVSALALNYLAWVGIASPRIAGQHPIYLARELYLFKDGSRNGMTSKLMMPAVMNLTDADILAISAYLASMDPTGAK